MFVFLVRKDENKMQTDIFGIRKLFNTTTREWYSQFHIGPERTRVFGAAGVYDPGLVFRGTGTYTIYGQTGDSNNGILNVSGSCPRIYVRDSVLNHSVVPIGTPMWKNVEVTFYSNTIDPGVVPVVYAGVQVAARTDHYPDTDLCNTRGISGKWNFDGRCHIEKETVHLADGTGNKQTNTVYPFPNNGPMPLNTWIGYKYIVRSCENDTACRVELYMDTTHGVNGGTWLKVNEFVDRDGWSADFPSCCDTHRGKVLGENYTVYLRTDGVNKQLYKWLSVREIAALN